MSENRPIMIQIKGLKKRYKLGTIGGGTLTADLQSWWAKIRHKEDPNSKIGSKTYGKNETFMALDGIDLTVRKGERLGIIGHNGAGKSTLLKLLSRVTGPTEGEICLNGRISSMLEVGTGFNPELTGRENIYLNGAILGMTKAEVDKKIDQIIEFSECAKFIDTPVKRYSSGMYVKLAFAVAAHLDSEILVMDEVLAVGDMKFQQKCLGKMSDVSKEEGRTILYVSHNMNTIRQLCDRCIVLKAGKIIFNGDVEEAIRIYMNTENVKDIHFDYANIKRSPNETRKLEMLGLDILEREDNLIEQNEELKFTMHCRCNKTVEKVSIRFEIFSAEGSIVGTAFADSAFNCKEGKYYDVTMSLKTRHIAPGKYKAVALTYEYNAQGEQIGVDRVDPALHFEIVEKKDSQVLWLSRYWGYVHFDDMQTFKIEEKNI